MSCSPEIVSLLTTRFLFWDGGVMGPGGGQGCRELRDIGSKGCHGV